MSAAKPAVSVLGLGMMGSALAAALLKAGYPITVWNRTAAKTGPLVAQGAAPAADVAEAVEAGELLVLTLTANDAVRELLEPLADRLRGRTIANLTNGTPAQARELAAFAAEHGARYLDGGIMASPQMIAGPHAYIYYSGDQEAFGEYEDTFRVLGGARYVGEDAGRAAVHDFALLIGMYGQGIGTMHAFALAKAVGIPAKEIAEPLRDWLNAMALYIMEEAEALDSGEHLTDVSSLAVNQAALPNLLNTLAGEGVTTEFFQPLERLIDRAVEEGYGADGLSRLPDLLTPRR
ncbi:NAD(P)-dependent oxidoreductase [Streptomyces qinzhouensis]|uniref:NAD(P)-dependent oxidoreductase n=1 Tax=Streptomyces qinzhouensis TaxID=2599401 RepID=A0A5B8JAK1_9ACTN|nr:NAD(P)-binding domain-containing protein [Streptomyces qinzhouensis]QDY78376.1 NAD(P)-dependent oxidoreductase [Streptomyces qinzhouensis]